MRRLLALAVVCLAAAGCGGKSSDNASTGGGNAVPRAALITQLLKAVHGTVGDKGTPCVENYLRARTDDELGMLLHSNGAVDDLDRAFTAAIVACVDG